MKFRYGAIPDSKETPPQGWNAMRELNPIWMQAIALPLGIGVAFGFALLWLAIQPLQQMRQTQPLVVCLSIAVVLLIPVHELIHAAVFPKFGLSKETTIGYWPARMIAYAQYDGPLTRERFFAVALMPFMIMSVAPLVLAAITGKAMVLLFFVSVLNSIASGGDLYNVAILLWQVPRRAVIKGCGWRTYWKHEL